MTPAPLPSATGAAEALALLRDDHRALREVFARYRQLAGRGASAQARGALARRACTLVQMHASIGEELVYPAAAPTGTADDLVRMGHLECETCRKVMRQVEEACPDEPRFDALVLALGQYVERRLEREELELFGRVRQAPVDLAELGRRIRRRHDAWMSLCR